MENALELTMENAPTKEISAADFVAQYAPAMAQKKVAKVTPQVPALAGMTPLGINPAPKKYHNRYRISARQVMAENGLDLDDLNDSIVPACCIEGCEVEPDGRCEHGCPSVLIALGVI